jgi:hypothetical protein
MFTISKMATLHMAVQIGKDDKATMAAACGFDWVVGG